MTILLLACSSVCESVRIHRSSRKALVDFTSLPHISRSLDFEQKPNLFLWPYPSHTTAVINLLRLNSFCLKSQSCLRLACALLDSRPLSQLQLFPLLLRSKHTSQRPARLRSHTTTSLPIRSWGSWKAMPSSPTPTRVSPMFRQRARRALQSNL